MTVAVLALQGAFIEHEHVLEELGVKTVELRQAADLDQPYDGLILPGGGAFACRCGHTLFRSTGGLLRL